MCNPETGNIEGYEGEPYYEFCKSQAAKDCAVCHADSPCAFGPVGTARRISRNATNGFVSTIFVFPT